MPSRARARRVTSCCFGFAKFDERNVNDDFSQEAQRLTGLLTGKTVKIVRRRRSSELLVEFVDGTRLYVDCADAELELSVTGGSSPERS
jgi:hypothetical protein